MMKWVLENFKRDVADMSALLLAEPTANTVQKLIVR